MNSKYIVSITKSVILVGFIVLCIPFVYDFLHVEEETKDRKSVELLNSSITGYDKGRISWRIVADKIWAYKSRYLFYANKIESGVVYNDNRDIIIDSIQAESIKINTKSNVIYVTDGLTARFVSDNKENEKEGLVASQKQTEQIIIKANELRHDGNSDKTYLKNQVQLIKEDFIIKPKEEVEIDSEENMAYIRGGFTIDSKEQYVSGNTMTIYIDHDKAILKGDLVFEKLPSTNVDHELDEQEKQLRQQSSLLYCDRAVYEDINDQTDLLINGNIKLLQKDKHITAESGVYSQSRDYFELEDNVTIILQNIDWLLDEEKKIELSNKDIKNSLNEKTTIICDKLFFDGKRKRTKLLGNIKIHQPDKEIVCDKLILYDDSAIVECFGNVHVIKTNDDKISSDYLKIDLSNETFLAKDSVYSEYHLNN